MTEAARLNADMLGINGEKLQQAMHAEGEDWYTLTSGRCPHLFSDVPLFISSAHLQQMADVIEAVERVVNSGNWQVKDVIPAQAGIQPEQSFFAQRSRAALGVFYGYDFHLNGDGVHLIEINTNAGGAFLNALLIDSQRDVAIPGATTAQDELDQVFLAMFRREHRLVRGDAPLACIAIVDEQPVSQYLYPEFLLAQRLFERNGIKTCIVDPADLQVQSGALYAGEQKIDLVYNRLTDFTLQQYPVLLNAWLQDEVVITPNPDHYARYADKRNLARLTDVEELREMEIAEADIAILQAGIPHTFVVEADAQEELWSNRKQLFFKPNSGFGSRGAYRGEKLTRRVFGEILQSGYVAQKLAVPGERRINDEVSLKYDVRAYVYDGKIQLVAARLYQGQTTNFRTQGGGFAQVKVVG
jgi:hypothetical protein